MIITANMAMKRRTQELLNAQKQFEQSISHLTPQRQAELLAIRQIALESARRLKV